MRKEGAKRGKRDMSMEVGTQGRKKGFVQKRKNMSNEGRNKVKTGRNKQGEKDNARMYAKKRKDGRRENDVEKKRKKGSKGTTVEVEDSKETRKGKTRRRKDRKDK